MIEDEASPKYGGMRAGLIFSMLVHSALLASVIFTIHTHQPLKFPEPTPMAVDILTPGDVTKLRQGSRTAKQMEAEAKETPETKTSKKEADKPKPVAANTPPPPPPPPPPPDPPAKEEPKSDPIADKIASAPPPAEAPPPPVAAPEEKKKLEEIMKEEERREVERKAEEKRKADEAKKVADKKKADDAKKKKEAELKRKKEEERKRKEAEAKKKNFSEDMTALLNKIPDKGAPPPPSESKSPNAKKGPVLGAPEGRDKQLSATERDMLISRITRRVEECYRPPVGAAAGIEGLRVTLIFDLRPDGTLAGPPKAVRTDGTRLTPAAAEAAERAVVGCQPYDLPKDKYEFWKGVELDFNPKGLFGG